MERESIYRQRLLCHLRNVVKITKGIGIGGLRLWWWWEGGKGGTLRTHPSQVGPSRSPMIFRYRMTGPQGRDAGRRVCRRLQQKSAPKGPNVLCRFFVDILKWIQRRERHKVTRY